MDSFIRGVRLLSRLCGYFAAGLIAVGVAVVCQMVFVRFVLNENTIWQTDFVTYNLVAATFVGSPYVLMLHGCGFFIPPAAIILMTAPIIYPIITAAGFDPAWFGIILTINMEIGLIHPPVRLNIYIVSAIAPDVPGHADHVANDSRRPVHDAGDRHPVRISGNRDVAARSHDGRRQMSCIASRRSPDQASLERRPRGIILSRQAYRPLLSQTQRWL